MKKMSIFILALSLSAGGILSAQESAQENGNKAPKFVLSVQPLGFIQAGPIIEGEIALDRQTTASAHVRFHALGAMSYLLAELEEDDTIDIGSMYFGIGARRYLFLTHGERQGFYIGGLLELGGNSGVYEQGERWEKTYKSEDLVFVFELGRRWLFGNFTLSAGGYLGALYNMSYESYYTDSSYSTEPKQTESGDIMPLGMAVLSLGWGF